VTAAIDRVSAKLSGREFEEGCVDEKQQIRKLFELATSKIHHHRCNMVGIHFGD
jgi:hypothetical protein